MEAVIKTLKFNIILLLFLSSCTIQKRQYNKGLHLQWRNSNWRIAHNLHYKELQNNRWKEKSIVNCFSKVENNQVFQPNHFLYNSESIVRPFNPGNKPLYTKNKLSPNHKIDTNSCDFILLRTGEEIKCKIIKIKSKEVRFKKCASTNGPTYIIKKSDISQIKYFNNKTDTLSDLINDTNYSVNKHKVSIKKNGSMGIASLSTSIAGFLLSLMFEWFFLGIPFLIFGVIFGIKGLKNRKLKGLAILGLTFCTCAIIIDVLWTILLILLFSGYH
ncbi:MAG: DUF4190 domain-containing protein [Bacteroidetes bacterium]|nr:DUF4190 domain-containing protein [Bacteroidota bacterium]